MKKIFAIILAVVLLSGCTLAQSGKGGEDQLTGFFITVSHKNGDTMKDHWDAGAAGMGFISNHDLAGEKLYAQFIGTATTWLYKFPEGCGLSCFAFDVEQEGQEPYRSSTISPEIDAHLGYYAGTEMPYRMEAVIYGTKDTNAVIQMNPVYQTPEGSVYVLSDKPVSYDVATMDGCSSTLSQTIGDYGCTATLTIRHVVLPEAYVIVEMDGENRPLRQKEFAPGDLPESYTPGSDAAYLILEARAGEDTVRTVYSPGDEETAMDTYYPGEYGLCIKGYTTIDWEGAK